MSDLVVIPQPEPERKIYGASTLKRFRSTKARIEQLDREILAILAEDHPQSVRHVFYRMTDPRLPEYVEKSDAGYRTVQTRLKELRRTGRVPYYWITDATRRGYHTTTYNNPADFLRRMKGFYRADLWVQSDYYCEVWTESRSIAGVIEDDCRELAVSLYPAGGFTSLTLAYQAAEGINAEHNGRDVVIYYIGDYDPAGVLIDRSIEDELRQHLDSDVSMTFERIAITEEQIEEHDLPTKPRKKSDRRSLHIEETVEAEAMPAGIMRKMLRDRIEDLLPTDALSVARVEEDSAKQYFERMAEITGSSSWKQ